MSKLAAEQTMIAEQFNPYRLHAAKAHFEEGHHLRKA
jgi:hypothetical protein